MSVFALGANAQSYCSPTYTLGCTYGDDINDVYIGTFSDTATGCSTGNYYVATSDTIYIQQTAPTSVEFTSNYSTQYFAIWGDWNNDGDWDDAGEHLWSSSTNQWNGNVESITIPSTVSLGSYRMRIRSNYSAAISATESCSSMSYGEVHDYTVTVTTPPACPAPTFASITASDSSATLTWNSNDTTFVVEYGTSGFVNGLGLQVTASDTFATITGLSSNTAYDFYIKTDCTADTNGYSTNVGPFFVKTLCTSVSTPLYESFDTDSTGGFSNPNAPSCWYYAENSGAAGYGYIAGSSWNLSPYSGTQMYYLYNSYDSAVEALISPAIIGLDSGTKQMDIYMACTGWSSGNDVIVGTVSSPTDLSNFNAIDTISVPNGASWNMYTVYFDASAGYNMSDQHIAIISTSINTYTAVYFDEIIIKDAPQCLPPSALSIGSLGADSAEVNFTAAGIATYLEYGPVGFVPDFQQSTGTLVTASLSPHWLTGLDTNTSYDVYVYQMCVDSTVSPAFGPATFKTLQCAPSSMCTFDIELTDTWGDGWNGAQVEVLNSSGGVEYTLGAGFTTGTSYTETIMVCTGETFTIQVSVAGSYPSEIGLNVLSNSSVVDSYTATSATTVSTQMAQFTASCNAACPPPKSLTYAAGKNDATFTFDQNGGSATYVYEWGPVGFAQSTGIISNNIDSTTSNTFSIFGLSAATCYDVFLIGNCGASGVSDTLGPLTFCTNLCDTTDLCTWTMSMYDSWGDGWNGAEVQVLYNGAFGQSFTFLTGDSSIVDFQVCSGTQISVFNSAAGSYPSEVSYVLSNSSGTQSTSVSTGNFTVGVQDTLVANCVTVSCPMPSNLTNTNIGATTSDISWTGGTGTFLYQYRAQGTTTGPMLSGISTATTASMMGLTPSTTYDFYVKEACAPGDTSMTMYHVFTTDSCAAITLGNPQFNVDSVNAAAAALTFNWNSANTTGFNISFGDGNLATGVGGTVSHSYTANGTYSVTLTVYSDCDTVSKTFNVQVGTIGIEDNAGITALIIYPNPTQGLVTIDGEISHNAEVSIRIINYLGQEILADEFDPTSSVLMKTYDLSAAGAGAYLIEVATNRDVVQKSIIVRH
ncbi:MAG TPA: hypothetical protein DIT65_06470 [Cryomorphaceae bacterium]|nr:hypothetical protein [Cryomorphaceae bacterium]